MIEEIGWPLLGLGLVVCPALLVALIHTKVPRPLPAAFGAAAAVAFPWFIATAWALFASVMAHTKQAYHNRVYDVMFLGLLVLPLVAAIWMYTHKRGGGMRGLIGSTLTALVTFLKFLRKWGVNGNNEQSFRKNS